MRKIIYACCVSMLLLCSCSRCDYDKPDTRANRNGFERHLGISPDKDVTGIYFYADEWGADASYWLAFSAPPEIINRIIEKLELQKSIASLNEGGNPNVDKFPWWNMEERRKSEYYHYQDEAREVSRQLWYYPETQKCQIAITYW